MILLKIILQKLAIITTEVKLDFFATVLLSLFFLQNKISSSSLLNMKKVMVKI